ncbi:hypothetical protein [Lentzea sp.]
MLEEVHGPAQDVRSEMARLGIGHREVTEEPVTVCGEFGRHLSEEMPAKR